MRRMTLLAAFVASTVIVTAAGAATWTIQGPGEVEDAGIRADNPDTNYSSKDYFGNTGKDRFLVQHYPDGDVASSRVLMRFDLSEITEPTVTSATLYLSHQYHSIADYTAKFAINDMAGYQQWVNDEVTYNEASAGNAWSPAMATGENSDVYGSYPEDRLVTHEFYSGDSDHTYYGFDIDTSVVQGWLDNPSSNNGIMIHNPRYGKDDTIKFYLTNESGTQIPYLAVTTVPEPATLCLLVLGGLPALIGKRK